mgnify:CR=1 FL=1
MDEIVQRVKDLCLSVMEYRDFFERFLNNESIGGDGQFIDIEVDSLLGEAEKEVFNKEEG